MKLKEFYFRHEKPLLLGLTMLCFLIGFPSINFYSVGKDAHILLLGLDNLIPFLPWTILPYLTAFFMPLLAYFFVKDIKLFRKMIISWICILVVAFITYLVYPVEVILRADLSTTIFRPVFELYYVITPPYNSFPSLHVAQPFIAAFYSYKADKKYWWMTLWAAIIAVSILFTKVHYFVDLIAGLILAVAAYFIVMRFKRKKR